MCGHPRAERPGAAWIPSGPDGRMRAALSPLPAGPWGCAAPSRSLGAAVAGHEAEGDPRRTGYPLGPMLRLRLCLGDSFDRSSFVRWFWDNERRLRGGPSSREVAAGLLPRDPAPVGGSSAGPPPGLSGVSAGLRGRGTAGPRGQSYPPVLQAGHRRDGAGGACVRGDALGAHLAAPGPCGETLGAALFPQTDETRCVQ